MITINDVDAGSQDTIPFRILGSIIFLSPTQGGPSTIVTMRGLGIRDSGLVRIDFGTHQTITTTISSNNGTFSATFITSTQPGGQKTITVRDYLNNQATTTFLLGDLIVQIEDISAEGIADSSEGNCLKITVSNNSTQTLIWDTFDVRFGTENGVLNSTQMSSFFSSIRLVRSDEQELKAVSSFTQGTISFSSMNNNSLSPGSTTIYYVKATLNSEASSKNPRRFIVTGDENGISGSSNSLNNIWKTGLGASVSIIQDGIEEVSGTHTAIAIEAGIVVNPTTGEFKVRDGEEKDLLKIEVLHSPSNYQKEADIELSSLDIKFEDNSGNTFTTQEIQGLIGTISIVYDIEGDGYEAADPIFGSITGTNITMNPAGTITLILPDNHPYGTISYNGSKTYYLVVFLKDDASGKATRTFKAQIDERLFVIKDWEYNLNVSISSTAPYAPFSSILTPIPSTATITCDNSQSPTTITDTAIEDLIRLNITNQGTISAGSITFASITLSFGRPYFLNKKGRWEKIEKGEYDIEITFLPKGDNECF
ncbi:MAG: hypothetical protein AB1630_09230 [bacterium]